MIDATLRASSISIGSVARSRSQGERLPLWMKGTGMSNSLPCPLCSTTLEIRKSIKGKPYTVCGSCGMQMFIRKEAGISALKNLIANGGTDIILDTKKLKEKIHSHERELAQKAAALESAGQAQRELPKVSRQLQVARAELDEARIQATENQKRLAELENVVSRACPECGEEFRIREDLIKTSWLDGRFVGYRCPREGCMGVAPPLEEN